MKFLSLFPVFVLVSMVSFSQIREIPKQVEETFTEQYPDASDVEYKDQLTRVHVHFTFEGQRYIATYDNKGRWKGSEKEWDFEKLSEEVKEGFSKSKFADEDWEADDTAVLYLPGGAEQYRIRVKKNDLQKKYLYFNTRGRLLRESITL